MSACVCGMCVCVYECMCVYDCVCMRCFILRKGGVHRRDLEVEKRRKDKGQEEREERRGRLNWEEGEGT